MSQIYEIILFTASRKCMQISC
uniref:Uncharacterized protein n=1 Tax=Anguilla anguilla TaxID=7936 RepID=A0A0E9S3Y9_ANGAN